MQRRQRSESNFDVELEKMDNEIAVGLGIVLLFYGLMVFFMWLTGLTAGRV